MAEVNKVVHTKPGFVEVVCPVCKKRVEETVVWWGMIGKCPACAEAEA